MASYQKGMQEKLYLGHSAGDMCAKKQVYNHNVRSGRGQLEWPPFDGFGGPDRLWNCSSCSTEQLGRAVKMLDITNNQSFSKL